VISIDTRKLLFIIIFIAVCLRILFVILFVDLRLENYWEFGIIADNLKAGRGYSLFYFTGNHISQVFDLNITPFPSAFMPPLYVYFIYPFMYIDSVIFRNILLIGSQIIISVFTIILIFNFCKKYFNYNTAIISAILAAIIPEFIYITTIFNAVTHYHFFIMGVLMINYSKIKNIYICFHY
jgi:4-amino-4-deoxy-L-arabinose transferase-like glycosyltransferase